MTELVKPSGVSARHLRLRKDREMQFVEQRFRQVEVQQAQFRRQREAERVARAAQVAEPEQAPGAGRRTVRRVVGGGIVRLGERVAGDALGKPALTG